MARLNATKGDDRKSVWLSIPLTEAAMLRLIDAAKLAGVKKTEHARRILLAGLEERN